jgi:hypothetical protein
MTESDNVRRAIEAMNPGYEVVQMTDLSGLSQNVMDELLVAVVSSGPPLTHPDQLAAEEWKS